MRQLFVFFLAIIAMQATAQSVNARIIPNDPAKYRELSAVHAGAGTMEFTQLIGRTDLSTNFLYLHTGVIDPKSGIGHHFHHTIEEMYFILDGEAEFTVNGRTATIKAPAVVPCKMGDSHAIYNPTDKPIRWLNFAVSLEKARSDAFDLGDDRVGVTLEPVPSFVSARLEKEKLSAESRNPTFTGGGVLYRRLLEPTVFKKDWNNV